MKRLIALLLTFVLLLATSAPVFADIEEKLQNHWAKDEIDIELLLHYFSYLAREDFKRLNLDEPIAENEFLLSFSSLLKDKGYDPVKIGWNNELARIEMIRILGDKLLELEALESDNSTEELPFIDVDGITEEQSIALTNLYNAGVIHGQSNEKFNPYASTTQAEAIIVLQMVNSLLDSLSEEEVEEEPVEIPFVLSGIAQSYSGQEGIITKVEGDKMLVTATKMFPTPGYNMGVEKIAKENGEYKIYLDITPPDEDAILPQVITYKTITIEIDKKYLGDAPYNFVWGNILAI